MVETHNRPFLLLLTSSGGEPGAAEQLRADLGATGMRVLSEGEWNVSQTGGPRRPALILVLLSGELETDASLCHKWVARRLAPVVAVSANHEEIYALALFAAGVEDVIQRPVKTRELEARIHSILRRSQPAMLKSHLDVPPPACEVAGASREKKLSVWQKFVVRVQQRFPWRNKPV